jgi:two-component system, NarL family, nitrate/nitrite response regulator NarL
MNNTLAPGGRAIRVLVADNSRIHARLLADALKVDPALEAVPFESDSSGLVAAAKTNSVDVLVISPTLDEQPSRGFEVLREMRSKHLRTRSVLLLDSSKDDAVLQAFRAGVRGVFGRTEPIDLLSKCVRCVHQGQIWANSKDLSIALGALANSPAVRAVNANGTSLLTERELQVVHCLSEGLTNREIAERLNLSRHTVKNYFFRIFDKLGVSSRVELLFMTLNQNGGKDASGIPKAEGDEFLNLSSEPDKLKKAAEGGAPAAQLALASWYLNKGSDPENLVQAYTWYLVATERALETRALITKMMTPEQIDEAQQNASVWLSASKRPPMPAAGLKPRSTASLQVDEDTPPQKQALNDTGIVTRSRRGQ